MDDMVGRMVAFESGQLTNPEALELFSELIKSGMVWALQGAYGRTAGDLIERGVITADGDLTDLGRAMMEDDGE